MPLRGNWLGHGDRAAQQLHDRAGQRRVSGMGPRMSVCSASGCGVRRRRSAGEARAGVGHQHRGQVGQGAPARPRCNTPRMGHRASGRCPCSSARPRRPTPSPRWRRLAPAHAAAAGIASRPALVAPAVAGAPCPKARARRSRLAVSLRRSRADVMAEPETQPLAGAAMTSS